MREPRMWAWIVPGSVAVAERPGGGGRSHRVDRRDAELAWWADRGVRTVVSGMRSRHGLLEAALAGFAVRWHPLVDEEQAARELPALIASVQEARTGGAVLVHVDRPGPWLAGVDAALRLVLGLAADRDAALAGAADDGLPLDAVSAAMVDAVLGGSAGSPVPAGEGGAHGAHRRA